MRFPASYRCLTKSNFCFDNYEITPIRYEDRVAIMNWRNEQMFHLRQSELLTSASQDNYFAKTVAALFLEEKPTQVLFSLLKDGVLIGYGGLVHIAWSKKEAEISFIMETALEKTQFAHNWSIFLGLIERVAFEELNLDLIRTYAYDLRPHLYKVLEKNHFKLEARLKDEVLIGAKKVDVVLHTKENVYKGLKIRMALASDEASWLTLSNDPLVRKNSYNQNKITSSEHHNWFTSRLKKTDSHLYIVTIDERIIANLKIEQVENKAIIGLSVSANERGKGLAPLVLIKCCRDYHSKFKQPIYAYIKLENTASDFAFRKAGFVLLGQESIEGVMSYVYILKNN